MCTVCAPGACEGQKMATGAPGTGVTGGLSHSAGARTLRKSSQCSPPPSCLSSSSLGDFMNSVVRNMHVAFWVCVCFNSTLSVALCH